jgi:hypothetical protein
MPRVTGRVQACVMRSGPPFLAVGTVLGVIMLGIGVTIPLIVRRSFPHGIEGG